MAKYIIASTRLNDDGSVYSVSHPIEVDSDTINTIKIFDKTYILEKHGQWIPGKEIAREFLAGNVIHVDYLNYRCSVCGAIVGERETMMYHFCPNCGADMKERKEDG